MQPSEVAPRLVGAGRVDLGGRPLSTTKVSKGSFPGSPSQKPLKGDLHQMRAYTKESDKPRGSWDPSAGAAAGYLEVLRPAEPSAWPDHRGVWPAQRRSESGAGLMVYIQIPGNRQAPKGN